MNIQIKKKIKLAKLSELNLPKLGKGVMPSIIRFRKMTKRLMMNDFFELLSSTHKMHYKTRYFEEQMNDPDWRNCSDRPISVIKKLNLRNLDYLHCLHGPKSIIDNHEIVQKNNYMESIDEIDKIDELGNLFDNKNPFDIFSKFPLFNQNNQFDKFPKFNENDTIVKNVITKKDKYGNITTITNTTKTNNYSINLLPFIPIRMPTKPGEKKRFFAYKLGDAIPGEINIYYYYIRDFKFLICDKSKFLPNNMNKEERDTLYNTIVDSAVLGIDQLIINDSYVYTEEDDNLLEELRNGDICQYG
jgi:hypothetical protein